MNNEPEDSYNIGYKKPPIETRFPKGKSGNPSGRPKDPEFDPGRIVQEIGNEEIIFNFDGKKRRMRKDEAQFRQLFKKALGGNLKAAKLIVKSAESYFEPDEEGPAEARFVYMADEYWDRVYSDRKANTSDNERPPPRPTKKPGSSKPRLISTGSQFRKVAQEKVAFNVRGKRVRMTLWEALARQLNMMVIQDGSSGAATLLGQIRKKFPGDPAPGKIITYLMHESDRGL